MDPAELIRRARLGDEVALGALLDAQRDHLRALADRGLPPRLKARIDASDIVQQTCLSVFRQIDQFQGDDLSQFAAWLRKMHERNIRNAVRDQLQTGKRGDAREEVFEDDGMAAADQVSPSQHAMRREIDEQVRRAMALLPDDERRVLTLRFVDGLTLVQISESLQISKDAVVWLMQKGMRRMRPWLPPDGTHR